MSLHWAVIRESYIQWTFDIWFFFLSFFWVKVRNVQAQVNFFFYILLQYFATSGPDLISLYLTSLIEDTIKWHKNSNCWIKSCLLMCSGNPHRNSLQGNLQIYNHSWHKCHLNPHCSTLRMPAESHDQFTAHPLTGLHPVLSAHWQTPCCVQTPSTQCNVE